MLVRYVDGKRKGRTEELADEDAKALIRSGMAEKAENETEAEQKAREKDEAEKSFGDEDAKAKKALDDSMQALTAHVEKAVNMQVTAQVGQLAKSLGASVDRLTVLDRGAEDKTGGFDSFGEFAKHLALGTHKHSPVVTPKYKSWVERSAAFSKGADGLSEGGADTGATLVPVEYANQLYRDVLEEAPLFSGARQYPINQGRSIKIPVRQITTYGAFANGGGSLGTWVGSDGTTVSPAAPTYTNVTNTLNKWITLLPVTEELLEDNNVALGNFIVQEGTMNMAYDLNQAFIRGTGTNQPLGILDSPILPAEYTNPAATGTCISVDRASAGVISYADLVNMKAHMWTTRPNDFKDLRWIAHPDAEAQFEQLKDAAGRNLYYAAGTINQSKQARLFGIPVIYAYQCGGVGTEGDVILADLSQYFVSQKVGRGVEVAMSIHLYFDSDQTAFRILYRVDGRPARSQPMITPNGGNARMGFVSLGYSGS